MFNFNERLHTVWCCIRPTNAADTMAVDILWWSEADMCLWLMLHLIIHFKIVTFKRIILAGHSNANNCNLTIQVWNSQKY
jgi:hypothetical protein